MNRSRKLTVGVSSGPWSSVCSAGRVYCRLLCEGRRGVPETCRWGARNAILSPSRAIPMPSPFRGQFVAQWVGDCDAAGLGRSVVIECPPGLSCRHGWPSELTPELIRLCLWEHIPSPWASCRYAPSADTCRIPCFCPNGCPAI